MNVLDLGEYIVVNVDENFAVIDRDGGVIHIIDQLNYNLLKLGKEFDTLQRDIGIVVAANSFPGGSHPGQGNPGGPHHPGGSHPGQGNPGGPHHPGHGNPWG